MRYHLVIMVAAALSAQPVAAHGPSAMDHASMDHDASGADAPAESGPDDPAHDHGAMDHPMADMPDDPMPDMDHSTMDHSTMDHSGTDGMMHHDMSVPGVPDQPGDAPAPPVPSDHAADAVFGPDVMAASRISLLRGLHFTGFVAGLDMLEYRIADGTDSYLFDGEAWYGDDINRAVLAYSGEGAVNESPEAIELDAYWHRAINPWFNLQLGVRHDFRPDPERTYALVGLEGLAPYWIEVEAQAFVSDKGDVHFRGMATHDMRITQQLVFEPEVELDVALQDVPELGIGSGLESFELSGRLRYEIKRNLAPYVGVSWERKLGDSAAFARAEGEDASRFVWLAGVRFWF